MPGHKGNADFLPPALLEMDITEIPGADNLMHPNGIIAGFEGNLAQIAKAARSHFLVNGASAGILAAIMAINAEKLLVARGAHHSLYSGLILSGAMPTYLPPPLIFGAFPGVIDPKNIAAALDAQKPAALFLTSPTYEGAISDIAKIAQMCHNRGVVFIVDEAHGAHLAFSDNFPDSAIALGADIVVQSLHKTLPVLGQSAVLHISKNIDKDLADRLAACIRAVQTTSPSYLLMAQADFAIAKLASEPGIFADYFARLADLRDYLADIPGIILVDKNSSPDIFDYDPAKLVLAGDFSGFALAEYLAENFAIDIESAQPNHIIAMTSCADKPAAYKTFANAIAQFAKIAKPSPMEGNKILESHIPIIEMSPRQAFFAKSEQIPLKQTVGRVCAQFITPYPPGIPLIAPGEVITPEIIDLAAVLPNPIGLDNRKIISVII